MTYKEFFQKAKHLEFRAIEFNNIDYVVMSVEEEKKMVSINGDLVKLQVIETERLRSSTVFLDQKMINKFIRLYASDIYDED